MGKTVNIDLQLIEGCKRNEVKAQRALYDKYVHAMFNSSYRIVGNMEDAQDATQEAFIAAFRTIGKFKGNSSFGTWLKRIVVNKSIDLLKKKQKVQFCEVHENFSDEEPEEDTPFTPDEVLRAIENLPAGSRAVFTLRAIEGYDHQTIADQLQISVSTSKSQFARARQLLQISLQKCTS